MKLLSEKRVYSALIFLIGVLLLPALLVNLGALAFIDDEGIRSLVAFEMMQSGDYIQPTLYGENYYKKPPLYNWILLGFFQVTGHVNEWTARIPTVFFTLCFVVLIYVTALRATGQRNLALYGSLLTLVSGRILFWDSFLGLIDICFSLLIYGNFMWLYACERKQDWWGYFMGSWFLTGLAFLMKGLPGLVFQLLTVGGHLVWERQWRKLFYPAHFVGFGIFCLMVGGYYFALFKGADPGVVFHTMFHESAQRTPTHHGFWETLMHVLSFPLEMTYHFLPWSLLFLFVIPLLKGRIQLREPFIRFLVIVFLVNIPVYWISPEVYPRYLLMLLPAVMLAGYYLWQQASEASLEHRLFRVVFLIVGMLLALVAWLPLLLPQTRDTSFLVLKTLTLVLMLSGSAWALWRYRRLFFPALIVQLLVLRLAFNWFVIPDRVQEDSGSLTREDARRIGETYRDHELYLLDRADLRYMAGYYLTVARGDIVRVWRADTRPEHLYILDPRVEVRPGYEIVDSMHLRQMHGPPPKVYLVRYPEHQL